MAPLAYTVGHSTRTLDELYALLKCAGVRVLVDVRTAPGSRRNPQFAGSALAQALRTRGIAYAHEPRLGGFRRPRADSPNGGWRHAGFRGYADHMDSADFLAGLERLQEIARAQRACVMCAEAQWWRCHRRLIADALLVRGWRVLHLGLGRDPVEHALTPFAVVGDGGRITYPPSQQRLELSSPAARSP